jgi:hypothetical protein
MARSALDLDVPFDEIYTEPAAPVTQGPVGECRAAVLKPFRNRNMRNVAPFEIPEFHITAETSVKGSKHDTERTLCHGLDQLNDKVYYEVSESPDGGPPADIDFLDLDVEEFTAVDDEVPVTTHFLELSGPLPQGGPPLAVRFTIDPLLKNEAEDWQIKNIKKVWASVWAPTGTVRIKVGIMKHGKFIGHPRVTMDSAGGRRKSRTIGASSHTKRTFTTRARGLKAYNDYCLYGGWNPR